MTKNHATSSSRDKINSMQQPAEVKTQNFDARVGFKGKATNPFKAYSAHLYYGAFLVNINFNLNFK